MILLVKSWVLNHNVDVVEIIHNPTDFFIIFFSEQTLRSSDKYWDSKLPYLQNPLLRQRARWNSWERLFCFHWKSLQCRTLQNTCLPVWSTRSCKSLRKNCLQMNFTCAFTILKWCNTLESFISQMKFSAIVLFMASWCAEIKINYKFG